MREALMPAEVPARLATLAGLLHQNERVVFAYLFGSAARRRMTPLSDVDVAVFLDDPGNAADVRLDILDALSRHLGTDRVDVVVLNTAPTALAGRILLDRVVLLDRQPARRHRFESLTLREFHDFRRLEHAILEERFRRG
jgi:predicted nucleotidyltransferase